MEKITMIFQLDTTEERDEYTGELLALENFINISLSVKKEAGAYTKLNKIIAEVVAEVSKITAKYTSKAFRIGEATDSILAIEPLVEAGATLMSFDTDRDIYTELVKDLETALDTVRAKYSLARDTEYEDVVLHTEPIEDTEITITKFF